MQHRALSAVLSNAWAITPDALHTIVSIAEREHEFSDGNLEALEKRLGRPLGNTETASVRNGVAIIPVDGPLFAKANLFTAISGATSYDVLARDFEAAISDPTVSSIVLKISSPGGAVEGVSQFAEHIKAARGTKPIVAYASGECCSAAYWLASAADRIVAADTAIIGSIGVQMGITQREPRPGEKAYRFVSSQSPNKNAGPDTEAGSSQIQQTVDHLAQVFIETVASNRGVSVEKVLADYGQGAVFVAHEAANHGMIQSVSSFETLLNTLQKEITSMNLADLTADTLTEKRPDLVAAIREEAVASVEKHDLDAIRAEGAAAERERLAGIEALAMPGAEEIIAAAKADPKATADNTAIKVLQAIRSGTAPAAAASTAAAAALAGIQKTEQDLTPPVAVEGKDKPVDLVETALASAKAAGIPV